MLPAPTAPSEGSAGLSRSELRRVLSTKSELTSSGVAFHRRNTRRASHRCSAALLGSITLGVPLCFSRFRRNLPNRVALEEDRLFRRLFPAGPDNSRGKLSLPAGGDRTFRHSPHPYCRCRPSGEAGTSVPITCSQCTSLPSRKSEKYEF